MGTRSGVAVGRVYDARSGGDVRVLVDRIWPRGMRKDAADLDDWCKHVGPSAELRKWFGHDPARFDEFARRYRAELADSGRAAALQELRERAAAGGLVLLTAARDPQVSHAAVLQEVLHDG
ncbi:DUF488 domain-containing protein [Pseudonocardia phyllosphaerae]|uniref:DUF488 domain-containing protein n=1 Tax=Pseudonocardia phyllosphaerae TaxID=3390502 RepID=UPI003979A4B6